MHVQIQPLCLAEWRHWKGKFGHSQRAGRIGQVVAGIGVQQYNITVHNIKLDMVEQWISQFQNPGLPLVIKGQLAQWHPYPDVVITEAKVDAGSRHVPPQIVAYAHNLLQAGELCSLVNLSHQRGRSIRFAARITGSRKSTAEQKQCEYEQTII